MIPAIRISKISTAGVAHTRRLGFVKARAVFLFDLEKIWDDTYYEFVTPGRKDNMTMNLGALQEPCADSN